MWIFFFPFNIDLPGFYACGWIGSNFVWGFAHSQRLWKISSWRLGYEDWYSEMSRDGIEHLDIEMWVKFATGCEFSKFPWAETFLFCIRWSLHFLCCWTHFKIQRCCETTWLYRTFSLVISLLLFHQVRCCGKRRLHSLRVCNNLKAI